MALEKSYDSKYMVTPHVKAYHRIIQQRYEVGERIVFIVYVYDSIEARLALKEPIDKVAYEISINDPKFAEYFSFAVIEQETTNVIAQFYKYLKEQIDYYRADTIDV